MTFLPAFSTLVLKRRKVVVTESGAFGLHFSDRSFSHLEVLLIIQTVK